MDLEYRIIRSKRKTISIEIRNEGVIVRAPQRLKEKEITAFIEKKRNWIERHLILIEKRRAEFSEIMPYTEQELVELTLRAKEYIPKMVEHYARIIGVTYGKITIRRQKTLWGSCTSKGNLSFNCVLMELPDAVVDSVIVHELCHRKHMNHSQRFYDEVLRVFPEYHKYRKILKIEGREYLQKLKAK